MSDKTAEDVLDLAKQRITQRDEHPEPTHTRAEKDRPWRYAFLAFLGVLLLGLLFAPGFSLDQKMYIVLHGMCSQEHGVHLGGIEFPICARCSGIYITALITAVYLWAIGRGRAGQIPPLPISIALLVFLIAMGIDGLNSMTTGLGAWSLYEPRNEYRSITGTITGIGMAVLLMLMVNLSLRKNVDDQQPVIKNWRELLILLAINFLVVVAIYGNLHFMAWPLAILAFLGMSGVLYTINLIMVSLVLGYDGSITSMKDLARPATIALFTTLVLLGGMSAFRFWMEAQGIMPAV